MECSSIVSGSNNIIGSGPTRKSSPDVVKVLVLYCCINRSLFAHAVRRKRADEHVFQQIIDNIAWLGHVRLVLRSDNEPAILALVTEALRGLRVQLMDLEPVSSEVSAPYDPETSGAAEAAVQNVKNSAR